MDIYVINLDKRQDRLRDISSHLASLGLEFIRVSAIDGSTLEENEYSVVDRFTEACWLSHQLAFSLAVNSPANNILVLEDDALLDANTNWIELLDELDSYITRSSIDVLQLGFVENVYRTNAERLLVKYFVATKRFLKSIYALVFGSHIYPVIDSRWDCLKYAPKNLKLIPNEFNGGAHCYAISRRAAIAFLKLNIPIFLPADDFFCWIAGCSLCYQRFKIARTNESLAPQRYRPSGVPVDSDIEPYIRLGQIVEGD